MVESWPNGDIHLSTCVPVIVGHRLKANKNTTQFCYTIREYLVFVRPRLAIRGKSGVLVIAYIVFDVFKEFERVLSIVLNFEWLLYFDLFSVPICTVCIIRPTTHGY